MRSMKLFRLAVLFVVAVALVAGTSASVMAGGGIPLVPAGDEPNASGQVYTKGPARYGHYGAKVVCKGLIPGATYGAGATWLDNRGGGNAYLGAFVANNNGAGQTAGIYNGYQQLSFFVYRVTGTTVLLGGFGVP